MPDTEGSVSRAVRSRWGDVGPGVQRMLRTLSGFLKQWQLSLAVSRWNGNLVDVIATEPPDDLRLDEARPKERHHANQHQKGYEG